MIRKRYFTRDRLCGTSTSYLSGLLISFYLPAQSTLTKKPYFLLIDDRFTEQETHFDNWLFSLILKTKMTRRYVMLHNMVHI